MRIAPRLIDLLVYRHFIQRFRELMTAVRIANHPMLGREFLLRELLHAILDTPPPKKKKKCVCACVCVCVCVCWDVRKKTQPEKSMRLTGHDVRKKT